MKTIAELFAEHVRYAQAEGWKGMVWIRDAEHIVPCDEYGHFVDVHKGVSNYQKYATRPIWTETTPKPPEPRPERRKRGRPVNEEE